MPIYEYVCEEPGKESVVIELLRSVADADKPVSDPEGKGRVFKRRLSVFASGGNGGPEGLASARAVTSTPAPAAAAVRPADPAAWADLCLVEQARAKVRAA